MSERIGVSRGTTIDSLLRQQGRTAEVPYGVGKLRLRDGRNFNLTNLEGNLDGQRVKEELCFDGRWKVTYHSGTVFDHDTVNLRVLKAIEAIAVARGVAEIVIRDTSYGMGGAVLTGEMAGVLSAVGYAKSNYNRGFVKRLSPPHH
jgi:hypothetical protein